jgi:hypothetical protein
VQGVCRISRSMASIASRVVFSHSARSCDAGSGNSGSEGVGRPADSTEGLTKSNTSSPTAGFSPALRLSPASLPSSAPAAGSGQGFC